MANGVRHPRRSGSSGPALGAPGSSPFHVPFFSLGILEGLFVDGVLISATSRIMGPLFARFP